MKLGRALLLAIFLSTPAVAIAELLDGSDPIAIVNVMQKEGYRAKLTEDFLGDPKIEGRMGKTEFGIFFYGCVDGEECDSIQFSVGYDLTEGMGLDQANEWNSSKRLSAVNLDEEMDPFLQMDVILDGGVTPENFIRTLETWHISMDEFEDFIGWQKGPTSKESEYLPCGERGCLIKLERLYRR